MQIRNNPNHSSKAKNKGGQVDRSLWIGERNMEPVSKFAGSSFSSPHGKETVCSPKQKHLGS